MAILTGTLFLIQSCKTVNFDKATNENFDIQLSVFQNGSEHPISNLSETIEIDKKEFSLRFYNKKYDSKNSKFYSAQIAAFTDKSEFDKIRTGLSITELPCFEPGSGMAPDLSGKYESLIFKNSGHNYAPYENSESKRLNLLKESDGGLLKLEFEINALYYNSKHVKMTKIELKEFYIAFLINKNLNGKIDEGELIKLTIKIK